MNPAKQGVYLLSTNIRNELFLRLVLLCVFEVAPFFDVPPFPTWVSFGSAFVSIPEVGI